MSEKKEQLLDVVRVEKKYQLTTETARGLQQKLNQMLKQDQHNKEKGYQVRSLYFDSFYDTDYYDKEDGYLNRRKIRLRVYSAEQESAKLELKQKDGEYQYKKSLIISKNDAVELIHGKYGILLKYQSKFALDMYQLMSCKGYRPRCVIEYERLAFMHPTNDIRVTFDSNIRASECDFNIFNPNINLYPVCHPDNVTLEVKYNHFLFGYIKEVLKTCDRTQVSISKYVLGRSVSRSRNDNYI